MYDSSSFVPLFHTHSHPSLTLFLMRMFRTHPNPISLFCIYPGRFCLTHNKIQSVLRISLTSQTYLGTSCSTGWFNLLSIIPCGRVGVKRTRVDVVAVESTGVSGSFFLRPEWLTWQVSCKNLENLLEVHMPLIVGLLTAFSGRKQLHPIALANPHGKRRGSLYVTVWSELNINYNHASFPFSSFFISLLAYSARVLLRKAPIQSVQRNSCWTLLCSRSLVQWIRRAPFIF